MHKEKKKKHITTAKFVSGEMVAWCLQKPQMTRSTSGTGRQQKLCSWTYKMSQSFMDILLSTPCQLRAMWLCLYLQEKNTVQWSDCEILAHVADSSVRAPCWRNSICNSFNSAGFFSPLFIPFSKFFWKAWPVCRTICAMKPLIPVSAGITIWSYTASGESPPDLIKASSHQREAHRRGRENHTKLWGRACPSSSCCFCELAVLFSWKHNGQEHSQSLPPSFFFFFLFSCILPRPSCTSPPLPQLHVMQVFSNGEIPREDPVPVGLWQCQHDDVACAGSLIHPDWWSTWGAAQSHAHKSAALQTAQTHLGFVLWALFLHFPQLLCSQAQPCLFVRCFSHCSSFLLLFLYHLQK